MMDSRRCGALVGMVAGGRGASCCRDAVPVSTLGCLAGWVLAHLRAVCSMSGNLSAAVWSVPRCVSRLMVGLCVVGLIALQPTPV